MPFAPWPAWHVISATFSAIGLPCAVGVVLWLQSAFVFPLHLPPTSIVEAGSAGSILPCTLSYMYLSSYPALIAPEVLPLCVTSPFPSLGTLHESLYVLLC